VRSIIPIEKQAMQTNHPTNQPTPPRITTPLDGAAIAALKAGDRVLLSGVVYTARDAAHQRLVKTLQAGEPLPLSLDGQVIYYAGPAPARPGQVIGPAGPTTAGRMDSLTIPLLEAGLKGMIGKGSRSPEVRQAIARHHAIYLVAVGGAAALVSQQVVKMDLVAYADLGTEAIYRLEFVDLPLVVANDIHGGDLFEQGVAAYRQPEVLE
jgi:fumarate hydratase subunit beta